MTIPKFIKTTEHMNWVSNLMINCENAAQIRESLFSIAVDIGAFRGSNNEAVHAALDASANSYIKPLEYTLLSPYYFVQSKNNPSNSLKYTHTRTYIGRDYTTPIAYLAKES